MRMPLDLADEAGKLLAGGGGGAGPGAVGWERVELVEVKDAEVLVGRAGEEVGGVERGESEGKGEE